MLFVVPAINKWTGSSIWKLSYCCILYCWPLHVWAVFIGGKKTYRKFCSGAETSKGLLRLWTIFVCFHNWRNKNNGYRRTAPVPTATLATVIVFLMRREEMSKGTGNNSDFYWSKANEDGSGSFALLFYFPQCNCLTFSSPQAQVQLALCIRFFNWYRLSLKLAPFHFWASESSAQWISPVVLQAGRNRGEVQEPREPPWGPAAYRRAEGHGVRKRVARQETGGR